MTYVIIPWGSHVNLGELHLRDSIETLIEINLDLDKTESMFSMEFR